MTPHEVVVPPGIHHPDVAVVVHVDPMWPDEHSGSELGEYSTTLVELEDNVEVVVSDTIVRSAAVDGPDRFAVRGDLHQAGRTPIASVGQRGPHAGNRPVRVGLRVLSLRLHRHRADSSAGENAHQTHSTQIRHRKISLDGWMEAPLGATTQVSKGRRAQRTGTIGERD
jgi:hypothetical protein